MSQPEGEFPFAWSGDYVAVELPYGGEAVSYTHLTLPTTPYV